MANNYVQCSAMLDVANNEQREWLQAELLKSREEDPEEYDCGGPVCRYVELMDEGLWIRDDGEGVDLEAVETLVQRFLKKFGGKPCVITYAETCSKQRIGEFGGGCLIITKDKTYGMNAHWWAQKQLEKLDKKKGKK